MRILVWVSTHLVSPSGDLGEIGWSRPAPDPIYRCPRCPVEEQVPEPKPLRKEAATGPQQLFMDPPLLEKKNKSSRAHGPLPLRQGHMPKLVSQLPAPRPRPCQDPRCRGHQQASRLGPRHFLESKLLLDLGMLMHRPDPFCGYFLKSTEAEPADHTDYSVKLSKPSA